MMTHLSDDCFAVGGSTMSLDEAIALLDARLHTVAGIETVATARADARILGEDVRAAVSLPSFANSAVDGWAVDFADLDPEGGTRLPLRGRVAAGESAEGVAARGCAVRIFTGAAVPAGADTVFMQEDGIVQGNHVVVPPGLRRGANIRIAGEDVLKGTTILRAGTSLRPQDLALASAVGRVSLRVRTPLRVALFSTGDEVQEPGSPLPAGSIYDANRAMLGAMLSRAGAIVTDLGIVADDREALRGRLASAARDHDLVITSGGVSTGEADHVKAAVELAGSLVFWRLAIKPGGPVAMGVVGGKPFLGLPGNPVAAFVTFCFVVRLVLARLSGAMHRPPLSVPVALAAAYRKKAGRREFLRVGLKSRPDGSLEAHAFHKIGAGILTSLTETEGLAELSEQLTLLPAGAMVPFMPFRSLI